ncbi:MAG TPA: hypothetical protein VMI92_00700 [Steroidobacteraceae bacterium]|nr:hypothetical protein [Steroidobacteraceae bacterium]
MLSRSLWIGATLFLALLVAGFWVPFFSEIPHFTPYISGAVQLHALVLFSWAVLLVVQPLTIHLGSHALHRRLGTASYFVMMAVIATSVPMLMKEYGERLRAGVPAPTAIRDEYLSAAQLLLVAIAYLAAVLAARRRDVEAHWRLMLCVVLLLLPAGLARTLGYWGGVSQVTSQAFCIVVNAIVLTVMVVRERLRHQRWQTLGTAFAVYSLMVAGWVALGRPV